MKPINLTILSAIALLAIFFTYAAGYQISVGTTSLTGNIQNSITREKRQVETLDIDDFQTTASENQEEESGFWDRVVKVALKLFSRFIEWLNS